MGQALFFNVPAYGHINPTLPLVQELIRRGETVIYYAMKEFQERIESTGAQFRDYKEISGATGFDFGTENDPRSFNLIKLARVYRTKQQRDPGGIPLVLEQKMDIGYG